MSLNRLKMKRIFAFILTSILILTTCVSTAFADSVQQSGFTFSGVSSGDTVENGDSFAADFYLPALSGVAALNVNLKFDNTVLEMVELSATKPDSGLCVYSSVESANTNGSYALAFANASNVDIENGIVISAKFKVKDTTCLTTEKEVLYLSKTKGISISDENGKKVTTPDLVNTGLLLNVEKAGDQSQPQGSGENTPTTPTDPTTPPTPSVVVVIIDDTNSSGNTQTTEPEKPADSSEPTQSTEQTDPAKTPETIDSAESAGATEPGLTIPGKCTGLERDEIKTTSVSLLFDKVKNAESYKVYYKKSSDKKYSSFSFNSSDLEEKDGKLRCIISGLKSGTIYNFKVKASNKSGSGEQSTVLKVATKPLKLKGLKLSTKSKSIKVTWTKQTCTGYQVQIAENKSFTKGLKKYTVKGSSVTKKEIKSLKKGKTYYVRVRAYKKCDDETVYGLWYSLNGKSYKKISVK